MEIISNFGTKIYDLSPGEIKNRSSLSDFKNEIRKWIPEKCPCKLRQTCITNICYI